MGGGSADSAVSVRTILTKEIYHAIRFITVVLILTLSACSRPMTPAEKHTEEDYEAYHQKMMQERAEAEYRKTPAYQKEMEAKQAKEDAAWKALRRVSSRTCSGKKERNGDLSTREKTHCLSGSAAENLIAHDAGDLLIVIGMW